MPPAPPDETPSSGNAETKLMPEGPSSMASHHPTHPTASIAGATRPQAGERLGEYRLIERIGQGGMGEVWRAEHAGLGRAVALKLMLRRSGEAWARFEREAKLAAGLDHPHIAKLYEFSEDPPFIAMQLVAGRPIAGAGESAIRALRDAALAVAHAHARGVLHRDLKPDNIVVDAEGGAFVLDFGLALPVAEEGERLTLSGEVVGTPAYMAPEQARGDQAAIGPCSDVYGLGATLYALLAGRPPYRGTGAWQILHRVIDEDPPRPGGDRDLETICLCAMAKDPARRYATAQAFADDLGRWLAREPVRARRAGIAYRLQRSMQRRPAVWGLGAALAAALAAGGAFGVAQLARANAALSHALSVERSEHAAQAARVELLELGGVIEAARAELRALDDELSRELDAEKLAQAFARVDALTARLEAAAARWPRESIVPTLAGEAALLRNREEAALAAFDRALAGDEGAVSAQFGAARQARLGRALARLRLGFLDQMARLFLFDDEQGYFAGAEAAKAIQADLDAAGASGDVNEREVLGLWADYLRAAADPRAYQLYPPLRERVIAQSARGGRHDEYARLLAAVLTGPPRALDEVTGLQSQAIARNHDLPQAWLLRGMEYGFAGRDAQAKADCDQALRLRPDYALALLLRAQVDDEHPAAERADIDAAIVAAPTQPKCLLVRAHLRQAADPAGALDDLRQAVAVAGAGYRGLARRELADLLRELGRRDEAIAAYRQVGDDDSRLALAELLAADPEAAERELAPLLGDAPTPARMRVCVQAREWRAKARALAGDHQAALDDWRWVITRAPNVLTARVGEGRELAALGQRAQALAALDSGVAALVAWAAAPGPGVKPETAAAYVAEALVARARLRGDAGNVAGARADVDEALRRRADDPDALALSAALLRDSGDAPGAAAVESRRVAALVAAGDARRARYELIAAEESYRAALAADAGNQAANAGLRAIAELRASVK